MKTKFNEKLFEKQIESNSCKIMGGIYQETSYTTNECTDGGCDSQTITYNDEDQPLSTCYYHCE